MCWTTLPDNSVVPVSLFGNVVWRHYRREKSEVQILTDCYAITTMNLAAALGFFSEKCSLESIEMLEIKHHLVTTLRVESWPGVLQMIQKHIKGWKIGLEAEMGLPVSEAYIVPMSVKYLV